MFKGGSSNKVDVVQADRQYGQKQVVCKFWVGSSSRGGWHLLQTRYEKPGLSPDEDDMNQMEDYEFYRGLIIKIGARGFFSSQEGNFRMGRPLFWEAVKTKSPKTQVSNSSCAKHRK